MGSPLQETVSAFLCCHWFSFSHRIQVPCNQSLSIRDSKLPFPRTTIPVPLTMYKMTSGICLMRQGVRTMQTVPTYEASMDTVNRGGAALVGTLMGLSGVAYQVAKKKTAEDIQQGLIKEK